MAQQYMADLVRDLFSNRAQFKERSDEDKESSDTEESGVDDCNVNLDDEGLAFKDSTDGPFVISAVEDKSIAHGFGLQEGDRLFSGNDCCFAKVEDIKRFFSSMRQGSQSFSLKIMRETYDRTTGQMQQNMVVINESYHQVCVTENPEVSCPKWVYSQDPAQKYRFKLISTDYYVIVKGGNLELEILLRKDLPKAVFKSHRYNDCTDTSGALYVVLEHEQTSKWVSMTDTAVSMVDPKPLEVKSDKPYVFKMAQEVGGDNGANHTFQSNMLKIKPAGDVYYLGFMADKGKRLTASPVQGHTKDGKDDNNYHMSTVFTLFTA